MSNGNSDNKLASSSDDEVNRQLVSSISLSRFLTVFVGSAILILGLSWLFLDESLKSQVNRWISGENISDSVYSLGVIAILSSDLLLPIPSSAVITHAGLKLGAIEGTLVSTVGITIGSLIGFGLTKWLGNSFIAKRISERDRRLLESWTRRFGVIFVVLLRPVPIFAEASVLLLAVGNMRFVAFLVWLGISNFFVCLFFATFGQWAETNGIGEFPSLLLSISIPICLLLIARFYFTKISRNQEDEIAQAKT